MSETTHTTGLTQAAELAAPAGLGFAVGYRVGRTTMNLANMVSRAIASMDVHMASANDDGADDQRNRDEDTVVNGESEKLPNDQEPSQDDDDSPLEERLGDMSYDEAEEYLDKKLRDEKGRSKGPLRSKNPDQGVKYYDGRGNSVQINRGYSDGQFTGDSVKSGAYGKISGGPAAVQRFPLK